MVYINFFKAMSMLMVSLCHNKSGALFYVFNIPLL